MLNLHQNGNAYKKQLQVEVVFHQIQKFYYQMEQ